MKPAMPFASRAWVTVTLATAALLLGSGIAGAAGGLPATRGAVYSQAADVTMVGEAAQDFGDAHPRHSCEAADDFVVPPGQRWRLDGFRLLGAYSTEGAAASLRYAVYADAGGRPGSAVCDGTAAVATDDLGDLCAALDEACTVGEGRYWLGAAILLDATSEGQAFWLTQGGVTGAPAHWRNPGDGFGSGCVTWCSLTDLGLEHTDLAFELLGEAVPE